MNEGKSSISIDKLSAKHLIGECLDLCQNFLKELASYYCQSNGFEFPIPNQVQVCSTEEQRPSWTDKLHCRPDQTRQNPGMYPSPDLVLIHERGNKVKLFIKTWLF